MRGNRVRSGSSARAGARRWLHREIVALSLIVFAFLSGLNGVLIVRTHGAGRIVAKINRGGGTKNPNGQPLSQGLFVRTDAGEEIRVPPALFDRVRAGQQIAKRAGGWTYRIDGTPWSADSSILVRAALAAAVCFVVLSVLAGLTGWTCRG